MSYLETKQDRAIYYFIRDLFTDVDGITIVDEFPVTSLVIPTISVENYTIDNSKFLELGNSERIQLRRWYINVFAKNKAQRDEYAYRIMNSIEDRIPVYDYDLGDPPTALPQLGCLQPELIQLEVIRIMPELVDKLYYRSLVTFTANYSTV